VLIAREAGCHVGRIDGSPYRLGDPAEGGLPLLTSASAESWRWLVDDVIGG
jgi:hypothetical protein